MATKLMVTKVNMLSGAIEQLCRGSVIYCVAIPELLQAGCK
jgi:hypothetical protein